MNQDIPGYDKLRSEMYAAKKCQMRAIELLIVNSLGSVDTWVCFTLFL